MTFDGFFPQFSENQIFVIGGTYNSEHNIKIKKVDLQEMKDHL